MANYKIKLEDDALFDYEVDGSLNDAVESIQKSQEFIHCKDYRGKSYCVNKKYIKIVYAEFE